ncbi:SDR family NAD(P)-dependent oxidoreductase [Nocardia heshunensis]
MFRGLKNPHLVLVTGGGRGIGRATCLRFAELGATVIVTDIDESTAVDTAQRIIDNGGTAHGYRLDVSEPAAWEQLSELVAELYGTPDVLVNNAGIAIVGTVLEQSASDWERQLGVNLWGVIHGCRIIGRQMVRRGQGGHIVNISSVGSYLPMAFIPSYSVSKAAVKMLSEVLRIELAGEGIGVTVICPGAVATGIVGGTALVGDADQPHMDQWRDRISRMVETIGPTMGFGPNHIAEAIVRSVRYNWAIVPVRPESWLIYFGSRLSPGLIRGLAGLTMSHKRIRQTTALLGRMSASPDPESANVDALDRVAH